MSDLNRLSLPVGVDLTKAGGSGEDELIATETLLRIVQSCKECLKTGPVEEGCLVDPDYCHTTCSAFRFPAACVLCQANGHVYALPQLRACDRCVDQNSVLRDRSLLIAKANSKPACKTGTQHSHLILTSALPDADHVFKIKRSFQKVNNYYQMDGFFS